MLKEFFARRRNCIRIVSYILLMCLVLLLVFLPVVWFYDNHVRAREFLMDTKNIQLSMRLLNIQYYGEDRNLYQPGTESGMAEDTLEEIKRLSDTEGEIVLVYWDYENNVPGKFYYRTDNFLATYEYDATRKEPTWEISRLKRVIDFRKD